MLLFRRKNTLNTIVFRRVSKLSNGTVVWPNHSSENHVEELAKISTVLMSVEMSRLLVFNQPQECPDRPNKFTWWPLGGAEVQNSVDTDYWNYRLLQKLKIYEKSIKLFPEKLITVQERLLYFKCSECFLSICNEFRVNNVIITVTNAFIWITSHLSQKNKRHYCKFICLFTLTNSTTVKSVC